MRRRMHYKCLFVLSHYVAQSYVHALSVIAIDKCRLVQWHVTATG